MAIFHRALFTWFILLVFLILLCLRLESRTHWNWFIVFIPMWIYDGILLIYVIFHMISHCRNGMERFRGTINKNIWYIAAIGLKMASQIIICIKLEYAKANLPIHVVMSPIWVLLVTITVMVSRYYLPVPELGTQVTEVPAGATAVLNCNSNDDFHNFMFWQLGQDKIIGPGNSYDESKYKYEVLSGKLLIKGVSPAETGYYRCVSKHIDRGNLNVGAVEMIVKQNMAANYQSPQVAIADTSDLEAVKIIFIVISLIVLVGCAFIFYRLKKAEERRSARLVMLNEEDDDEGSGDEIYNRTTTVVNDTVPTPGPSKPPTEHITGIDNRGLDADFNSVFQQISIDASNRNFI